MRGELWARSRKKTQKHLGTSFYKQLFLAKAYLLSLPHYLSVPRGQESFYIKIQLCHFCAIQGSLCIRWKVKVASQSLWVSWVFAEGKISKSLILLHVGGPNTAEFKGIHQQWCSQSNGKIYCRRDIAIQFRGVASLFLINTFSFLLPLTFMGTQVSNNKIKSWNVFPRTSYWEVQFLLAVTFCSMV